MQAVDINWLKKKYIDEGLSPNEIANKYKRYSASTITRYLKLGGIEMRNASESLKRIWEHKKHPWLGKKHTQETKNKIKNALTGKTRTEQHRKNLSKALKGHAPWCKGMRHSKETKKIMSEKRKEYFREHPEKVRTGEKNPMYGRRGEQSHWWGRKHGEETKKKIGKESRGRIHSKETKERFSETRRGYKNSNWRGGISLDPYSPEFNEELKYKIRKRDEFLCQFASCGRRENSRKHSVHHIDYNKDNNNPENLITLCYFCHPKTNSNRQYWQEYFKTKGGDKE